MMGRVCPACREVIDTSHGVAVDDKGVWRHPECVGKPDAARRGRPPKQREPLAVVPDEEVA